MIDVYTWATPNGTKVVAALEECSLPYRLVPVNLGRNEQSLSDYLAINPNGKIPSIVDSDGFSLFESGAILWYLAEKTGLLLPSNKNSRHLVNQWVMFQMSAIGPIFGQLHHFKASAPEAMPYVLARFSNESKRLLAVLDGQLAQRQFLVGDDYTIADVSAWPWIRSWLNTIKMDLAEFGHVRRWYDTIQTRPATIAAIAIYDSLRSGTAMSSATDTSRVVV